MEIHAYALHGDCNGVQGELTKGVPVDARDEQDYTPLAYAVSSLEANEEVLRLLIDSGADVNAAVDHSKKVPLGLAAGSGSLKNVQILLDARANINFESPKGYTVLINVMYSLHDDERLVPMAECLIRNGAEMDCETDYGESPLSVASWQGRFDAVNLLLGSGADPSPLRWTELMKAVALGTCDDVQRVLDGGGNLNDRDRWDRTPWLLTAFVEDVEKAKILYSAGASVNDRGRGGNTALIYCAARGKSDMLQWLVEKCTDIEAVDDTGNTALMLAAQAGETTCVQLLLEAGANPSRKNRNDENAMGMASNEEIIHLLVEAGEDIGDISTEMKRTLTGLHGGDSLNIRTAEYSSGMRPRFGRSNPEVMDIPFWREMVRAGISAYEAKSQFGDAHNMGEPAWCFSRFGTSFTELPDGRFVQIGGEHEDFYDPDFCIYNDVIIHDLSGTFQIMGYPKDVFPPTDFHSATYVDGFIYLIGGLGYHGSRRFGTTPIFRLDCETWKIEASQSSGDNPGWIYEHKARFIDPGILVVSGGKICKEIDAEEQHVENKDHFGLNLSDMTWTCL
ncbi:MAG: ankyrin repeat domain-containing protein [Pirellulaceae bacterium]